MPWSVPTTRSNGSSAPSSAWKQEGARDREESADIVAPSIRRLAREVFDCGERQYFGTRVSLTRSVDRSREREFDALYVGTRAVLLNETRSSPRTTWSPG